MINDLIESHIGYAHAIAAGFLAKYPPNVTRDDLEGAAEFGLVQAAHSYDPTRCAGFSTFAYYRVRGAIVDEVRKSWRATRAQATPDAKSALANAALTEAPTGAETDPSGHEDWGNKGTAYFLSLDGDITERLPAHSLSPADLMLKQEESDSVRRALAGLPVRLRYVLQAHYYSGLSLVSIGEQLQLSKSWISRLHAQALRKLRQELEENARPRSTRRRRVTRARVVTGIAEPLLIPTACEIGRQS